MKVALVYDRVNKWGGAERVLLALHEIWPDAPLFTGVYNPESAKWADVFEVKPSLIDKLIFTRTRHELFAWLMPFGFENFLFDDYDLVISVTSAEAKGIITKPKTLHICYCLTPTRYLWSNEQQYRNSIHPAIRWIADPVLAHLRKWDKVAASRPDDYVAISEYVSDRIKSYYNRESVVIYPPVSILSEVNSKGVNVAHPTGVQIKNYYLVVSRLVKYKKVDLVIKACEQLKYPLVIIGTGSEKDYLQTLAGSNTTFISDVSDGVLAGYYQDCKALITPQEEDFGLVAVEAQLMGKPVITFNKGGVSEIVKDGVTGKYFSKQTVASLIEALADFDASVYNSKVISHSSEKFSKLNFMRKFEKHALSMLNTYSK